MTKYNAVSLTGCSGSRSCGWYDDWCCGNSCASCGGSWGCGSCTNCCNGGCANGCNGGCANGCNSGCANGCSGWNSACCNGGCTSGCGAWGGCNGGCGGSCWGCGSCAGLWPDVPALQSGGVLVPRIIGSGRLCQRVRDVTLCVQDIPECARAPYALQSVSASGPVDWEFVASERFRALLRVIIPLTAVIRDCSGNFYTVHSSITVEVPVRITIPTADLGRAHVAVQPGVRLVCVAECSEDGCFTVTLAVLVDVYVARWEPSTDGTTIPCRPDLPLTLPPSFHNGCICSNGCTSC